MSPPIYYTISLTGLALFFLALWSGLWGVHLIAIFYGKWKLHRKIHQHPRETPLPAVSIVKPLVGIDPNLPSNLETFFTMNYPVYELLFCIYNENDPSRIIVEKLMEKYPHVDAKVFVGGESVGVNPKINNMQPGYEAAKYELILISDSGIRMKEDTLLDMAIHMTDQVGLVHQMPFTCDRKGFPAVLEKVFFGTSHARIYLCADFFHVLCATGMSAMMRKKLIDEVGGIKAFADYLAEDYFMSKAILDQGWQVRICSQPAWQNAGYCDIPSFQSRISRWTKLRIAMLPYTIIGEPITQCLVAGAFGSWAVNFLLSWDVIGFCLVHILIWFLLDYTLLRIVQNGAVPFTKYEYVISWVMMEGAAPYLFMKALLDPVIRWRVGSYRLKWGGLAEEIKTKL